MKTAKPANRRKFLLAAGLGTAGVAAAVVATGKKPIVEAAAAPAAEQPTAYHASEHIRKYYETTKV
ncbi:MAG: formate dehydrogenase [Usitatibacter sp.]